MLYQSDDRYGVIWANNEVARKPTQASLEAFNSYADFFSQTSFSSPRQVWQDSEAAVWLCTGASHKDFSFRFTPAGVPCFTALVSAVLLHSEQFQGRSHFLLPSHDQQALITAICRRHSIASSYDWLVPNKDGIITEESLIDALSPKTVMLSLSLANAITGTIQPLSSIIPICKDRGILVHLDLSSALGKVPLDPLVYQADILTFSGLPLGAIGGLGGCLFQHHINKILINAFSSQQEFLQSFYLGAIASLGQACKERASSLESFSLKTASLVRRFQSLLSKELPDVKIMFDQEERLPNVLSVAFPKYSAESLGFFLHHARIVPSLGYENLQPIAQVLQSCGIDPLLCHSTVGFSFDETFTQDQGKRILQTLCDSFAKLTRISRGLS